MNAFLDDLATVARRINPSTFVFQRDGDNRGYVQIDLAATAAVSVHRLWSPRAGRGDGSMMLRVLCDLADRHGVEITLKVLPFGPKPYPLSRAQLAEWYHRHGFEGKRWNLTRRPAARCDAKDSPVARQVKP